MDTIKITFENKLIEKLINKILLNPYIGLLLLIKDVIDFFEWLLNFKKTEIKMDSPLIINTLIDLFIAFVIYSILKQYKNKVDKKEIGVLRLNQKMFNARMELLSEILVMVNQMNSIEGCDLTNPLKNKLSILNINNPSNSHDFKALFQNFILPTTGIQMLQKESDAFMKLYGFDAHEIEFIRNVKFEKPKDSNAPIQSE